MTNKAIILLSGGLDSATVLAIAKNQGYELYALSFNYGQRHAIELEKAKQQADAADAKEYKLINIDLRAFGGSALTADINVPKHRTSEEMQKDIPVTYVPARNTIFLSFALAYAETIGAQDIFIGVNALDYSGYPDCRPEYIEAFENMANIATSAGIKGNKIKIRTPLIDMTKAQIIKKGLELGVNYAETISCYDPGPEGKACGFCDSCLLRAKGFKECDAMDPASKNI